MTAGGRVLVTGATGYSAGASLPPSSTRASPCAVWPAAGGPGRAGLLGLLYWYALYPFHALIFKGMLRAIAARAEAEPS